MIQRVLLIALGAALLLPASLPSPAPARAAVSRHSLRSDARRAHRSPRVARAAVTSRNPVTSAAAIAEGYWGAVPCAGQIQVLADRPLVPGLAASTDGWVTFNSPLGSDNLNAPAGTYTNCTISLAHSRWASWTDMESDWGMFCLTVVHEMGHLLGHQHSLVPGSVMAPVFTSDANVPSVCRKTWLPGWRDRQAGG